MKYCVSTDVGTWMNLLTFEPDPDYSPDAGTGLFSPISYKRCYVEFYVGKNPTYWTYTYRRPAAAARRGFKKVLRPAAAAMRGFTVILFTEPSKHLCRRYMRSTECLLVILEFVSFSVTDKMSWKHQLEGHSIGGAHASPTKVLRRLTASVNKTIFKPQHAAAANTCTYTSDFRDVKFRLAALIR